jgi:type IV pilus assembly protein PilQ
MSRKLMAVCAALAMAGCASPGPAAKERNAAEPAGPVNILDFKASGDGEKVNLVVSADGQIQFTVFKMADPARLIIDMTKANLSGHTDPVKVNLGPVTSVKPLYFAASNDSRLEVELSADVDYTFSNDNPKELVVTMMKKGLVETGTAAATEKTAGEAPAPAPAVEEIAAAPLAEDKGAALAGGPQAAELRLENVEFKQYKGLSRVVVTMSAPSAPYMLLSREKLNRLTLDLPGAAMNKSDERLINVNVEQSRVSNIAVFQFSGGKKPMVKVVVNLQEPTLYNVSAEGNKIFLDVGDEALVALSAAPEEGKVKEMKPVDEMEFEDKKYEGARISLDFFKADIHNILRIIADVSNLNVITSGDVRAEVTIKLKNVPWDRALEVILKNAGLDMIKSGNILRVATADSIQKERKRQEEMQKVEKDLEPLFTKIFDVNYETAEKMKKNLDSIKSERGKIEINDRTNTLIIKDTRNKIGEMAKLIRALDKKEQQVLIEARIVEVTHSHAKELGVQWGGFWNGVTNRNFPNTVGVTGAAGASPNQPGGGSLVNLPTSASSGAIGLTLGHVNGVALLDAKLMAMENTGNGRIVSMPKITTMNNKEATIESGREIPYQSTADGGGTTTSFKKATLSLKVTPHVTPDRNVRMEIAVNKDEADFANRVGGGAPPILTKQAKTEVLIIDGSTTVIGGLFKDTDSSGQAKVPGFGDIPLVGWMFRNKAVSKTGEELLIFITPKIVD